jgi:hypothetical protein
MTEGILNRIACPDADLDPLGGELDRIKGEAFTPAADRLFAVAVTVHAMHYPLPICGPASEDDNPGACPHDPESDWDEHFEADDGTWCCTSNALGTECRCGEPWKCEEYEAILTALTGKEESGGN